MTDIKEKKKNCATIFLLAGVGLYRKDLLRYGFLSAYLDDIGHELHHKDALYVLFKPEDMYEFQEFLDGEYKRTPLTLEDYDYAGGYVVVVYKFPKEFANEYQLFLEGKYSRFSQKYIDLFPKEVTIRDEKGDMKSEYSIQYHVFTRTDAIKKYWEEKIGQDIPDGMELWSKPDLAKEVLDINTYII